jgi:hypothetical protein
LGGSLGVAQGALAAFAPKCADLLAGDRVKKAVERGHGATAAAALRRGSFERIGLRHAD